MHSLQIIALTIALEASTQGEIGRQHVASSVWNRTDNHSAKSLAKVCLEPKQYSCWNGKRPSIKLVQEICRTENGMKLWEECMWYVSAMIGGSFIPTLDATNYITTKLYYSVNRPSWTNDCEIVLIHKDHVFLKERS